MNREDAIRLCRYVAAACPQQKFDDYTPNVWADILEDVDLTLDEGRRAVVAIKHRQPFVDPSEIIAEAHSTRARRIEDEKIPPPPPELVDDSPAYRRWLADTKKAIANGNGTPELTTGTTLRLERGND